MAPALFARSLACSMWVVDFHEGPKICLATNLQAAVFPTPAGPAKMRWGGLAWTETLSRFSRMDSLIASSSNRRGAYDSSQDAINKNVSEWVFQPLGEICSLCVQDFVSSSSQFDENTGSTMLACHCRLPLSFTVTSEALNCTTICALVVYSKVSHGVHAHLRDRPLLFEGVLCHKQCSWA